MKGVHVTSNLPVTVSSMNLGSCAAYLGFPTDALAAEYYVVTWWPLLSSMRSQIIISSMADDTEVVVLFSSSRVVNVDYNGVTYGSGGVLTFTLTQYQTFMLEDDNDLSGTYITANNPITVFGGNNEVAIDDVNVLDTTVAQLVPVSRWGTKFYAVTIPNDIAGYYLKFVTVKPNTKVEITNYGTVIVAQGGEFREISMPGGVHSSIISDKPIMVIVYSKGLASSDSDSNPAALLLPPSEQYLNEYYFSAMMTADVPHDHYLLLAVELGNTDGIYLDGLQVTNAFWTPISSSTTPTMLGAAVPIWAGAHRVHHNDPTVKFGAYVHGNANGDCSYAFPAGMMLQNLNPVREIKGCACNSKCISF